MNPQPATRSPVSIDQKILPATIAQMNRAVVTIVKKIENSMSSSLLDFREELLGFLAGTLAR